MLVREAVELFMKSKRSELIKPTTLKPYLYSLRLMLDFEQDVERVTTDDLIDRYVVLSEQPERYVNHPSRPTVRGPLSVYTLHKHVRHIRTFFKFLAEREVIQRNPARRLKRPRLPKPVPKGIQQADVTKMLDAAGQMGLREYAIVCVLAGTGCRLGGLVALTLDDIDFEARTMVLHEKFGKSREVRLPQRAAEALERYIDEQRPRERGREIFIGRRGPLTSWGIEHLLNKIADRAGVTRANAHAFRHGFVSYALKHGANLKTVQEILGHEDSRTTAMIYGAMAGSDVLEAHDRINFLPAESTPNGQGDSDKNPVTQSPYVQLKLW